MGSIGHPCSTIQGSVRYMSLMRPGPFSITSLAQASNQCTVVQGLPAQDEPLQAAFLLPHWTKLTSHAVLYYSSFGGASGFCLQLPCWTNSHYPRPELNLVINPYKLALLPPPL